MAGIVKDAGDDPDVTHLALVQSTVRRLPLGSGVRFRAGPGVGMVTRAGLPIPPGEPAINPVPRKMMQEAMEEVAARCGGTADVEITISIPNGAELAKQTWNPRLGIEGGLSILGTTGIVNPFSCSAWIASIHRGIDVIRAAGLEHAAACTGSTSEAAVAKRYTLPDFAYIDMGDFAGGVLKYLRHHPIKRLTLAGGFGKISKLAEGSLDLHSGRSQVNLDALAAGAAALGGDDAALAAIRGANTAMEALEIARRNALPLGDWVAAKARDIAMTEADGKVDIELLIFDRAGETVGHAGFGAR
jgi:cobalt-precorrin-5B (C1)-methyltransferase